MADSFLKRRIQRTNSKELRLKFGIRNKKLRVLLDLAIFTKLHNNVLSDSKDSALFEEV